MASRHHFADSRIKEVNKQIFKNSRIGKSQRDLSHQIRRSVSCWFGRFQNFSISAVGVWRSCDLEVAIHENPTWLWPLSEEGSTTLTFWVLGCIGAWHQEAVIHEITMRSKELATGHGLWSCGRRLREELRTVNPLLAFWDPGFWKKESQVMWSPDTWNHDTPFA
jgi:hypothetical protein